MSNLIKCIDLARAEKIDSYPVLTDCRAEIERLTADNKHLREVRSVLHARVDRRQDRIEKLKKVLVDRINYLGQCAIFDPDRIEQILKEAIADCDD